MNEYRSDLTAQLATAVAAKKKLLLTQVAYLLNSEIQNRIEAHEAQKQAEVVQPFLSETVPPPLSETPPMTFVVSFEEDETAEDTKGEDIFGDPGTVYADMLTGCTEAPATSRQAVRSAVEYHRRRNGYHRRLEEERKRFNTAIKSAGVARERNRKAAAFRKKMILWVGGISAVLFLILAIGVGITIGVNVTNSEAYLSDPAHLFKYAKTDDGIEIKGIKREEALSAGGVLNIPSTIDGKPVVAIRNKAFKGREEIVTVVLPDTVETVGKKAFYKCVNLSSVKLGDAVETVGEKAFYKCKRLTTLWIGSGISFFGGAAFEDCPINEIHIANMKAYCEATFETYEGFWIGNLYSSSPFINNPTHIYSDGEYRGHSLYIPDGVTKINDFAFYHFDNTDSQGAYVRIPKSLRAVGIFQLAFDSVQSFIFGGSEEEFQNSYVEKKYGYHKIKFEVTN